MFISRHPQWLPPCIIDQATQETPRSMLISVLTEHGIKQISFSIDSAIEVTPFATYLDIRLVQIPGVTSNSTSFLTKILTD
jgi:hypothetical protein